MLAYLHVFLCCRLGTSYFVLCLYIPDYIPDYSRWIFLGIIDALRRATVAHQMHQPLFIVFLTKCRQYNESCISNID
jgi:hypothetical protein